MCRPGPCGIAQIRLDQVYGVVNEGFQRLSVVGKIARLDGLRCKVLIQVGRQLLCVRRNSVQGEHEKGGDDDRHRIHDLLHPVQQTY